MTRSPDSPPLFRPEAVEFHERREEAGMPLALGERTTRVVFVLLLVGVVAALVAAWSVPVDEWARGRAVVTAEGEIDVVLPAGSQPRLRAGLPVRVDVAGQEVAAELDGPGAVADAETVRRQTGVTLPGGTDDAVVVARASPPSGAVLTEGATGEARVRLARRTLVQVLVPALGGDR